MSAVTSPDLVNIANLRSLAKRRLPRVVFDYNDGGADGVIANEEDIQSVLGLEVSGAEVTRGELNLDGYRDLAERVTREFGVSQVSPVFVEGSSGAFRDRQKSTRSPSLTASAEGTALPPA